jgi:hypothetical protein
MMGESTLMGNVDDDKDTDADGENDFEEDIDDDAALECDADVDGWRLTERDDETLADRDADSESEGVIE